MAYEDSDGSEDSDYSELSPPSSPPEKPPNAVMFYVENNRIRGKNDDELRLEFNEMLGKQEKQKWKTKHKRAKKRYQKLLQLYQDANPSFNINEYQSSLNRANRTNRNRSSDTSRARKKSSSSSSSSSTSRKRSRGANIYDSHQQYIGIYDSHQQYNNENEYGSQPKKRQKRVTTTSSIDELFKDINCGSKRVQRDPDKFKPSEDNKVQMQNLVQAMRDAARSDWECNLEKKPAINTSLLLDTVVSELSKKLFYKYYLESTDILEAIRDWIHPLPDGSLPALIIRTEMYRIVSKFALHEINNDNLQNSLEHYLQVSEDKSKDPNYQIACNQNLKSFAKTVMLLWAHKKETNSNKVLLRKIMEKWIRTLTGSDCSYPEYREEMKESQRQIQQRNKILQKQQRNFNFGPRKRAQIPEKAWHDFAVPADNIIDDDMNITATRFGRTSHPLQDRMNKTFKRNATSKQAARPSVTGRKIRK